MQAARAVARNGGALAGRRLLATAAASHAELHAHGAAAGGAVGGARKVAAVPLSNVEAQWAGLSEVEQAAVHEQLELVQQKDWKLLSIDEKKAAYFVAFGPHGPRAPSSKPGDGLKIILGIAGVLGVTTAISFAIRSRAGPLPRTMTKEWEEAANERGLEMKLDPITGLASEGYTGKGFVQTK
ncbi:COX4-domain-containing protein [Coprinopsis marcescibilis]|uniref:COX4-domain-containing protein n=1 Tax=Coprinopsis marcescibilis TaxID=230819 RepID=A0A5C3KLY7_COPMA|nr:COX4-domain-containing protein [Coprinopsis marcescibilis]